MTIPRVLHPEAKANDYKMGTATESPTEKEKKIHSGGASDQSYLQSKVKKWKRGLTNITNKREQGHL